MNKFNQQVTVNFMKLNLKKQNKIYLGTKYYSARLGILMNIIILTWLNYIHQKNLNTFELIYELTKIN